MSNEKNLIVEKRLSDNPFKSDPKLNCLKKIVSHCCLLNTVLAIMFILIGLVALFLGYSKKDHLIIFAAIALFQLVSGPLGWYGIKTANRICLMGLAGLNGIWIILTIIFLIVYGLLNSTQSFKSEVALHVGVVVFMGASFVLGVASFMLLQRLDIVKVGLQKPDIKVSAEGNASKK